MRTIFFLAVFLHLGTCLSANEIEQSWKRLQTDSHARMREDSDWSSKQETHQDRYKNNMALEHSRVNSSGGYVNASWISQEHGLIAAQAPISEFSALLDDNKVHRFVNTKDKFKTMVTENNVSTIFMLTGLVDEKNKRAHPYWEVDARTEKVTEGVLKRTLKHQGKDVTHYQYTNWPDQGVPKSTEAIKLMYYKMEELAPRAEKPILVHCSAGVGRTGVMLAIYLTMQKFKTAKRPINALNLVEETVKEMRAARLGMVQKYEQYHFIFQVLHELVQERALKRVANKSLIPDNHEEKVPCSQQN